VKIYLDDIRQVPEGWALVTGVEEFKRLIKEASDNGERIEAISFDHDLGENVQDGYDAVKWLAENYPQYLMEDVAIDSHSDNPAGRENIEKFVEFCRNKKEQLLESHREFKIK
jgi:hypothetical protein